MSGERLTVPALVRDWAQRQPGTPFMISDEGELTYGDLEAASRRVAARLIGEGVTKGTRVGLLMPNGPDWAVVALAVARAGAVLVPLSTLLRPPELEAQLVVAGVEHLVLVGGFRGRDYLADLAGITAGATESRGVLFEDRLPRLRRVIVWDGAPPTAARAVPPGWVDAVDGTVRPADDLVIIFTSGSQGPPKGVVHTHGGALGATEAGLAARCLGHGDRLYIPMPFFWVGGYGTGLLSVLVCGATLISESQPDPDRTLRLLERSRVTLFRGWPDQAAALAGHPSFTSTDLGSLRPGSLDALLPPSQRTTFGTRAGLLGMTESFGPYCGYPLDQALPSGKEGSCGKPLAGVELRVVDVVSGNPVGAGVHGEIQIRGRNMMRSICGRLRADVFVADGFYPTGDLGHLDQDGFLFFHGRRDDMFKVKGATVYPSEVEAALTATGVVAQAHVVDVHDAGPAQVGAAVVPRVGSVCTPAILERELHVTLSAFKIPTRWQIIDRSAVPTTASGKVDKQALRALFVASAAVDPQ